MEEIISPTTDFVRKKLMGMEGGHDWEHTYRVWLHAKNICSEDPTLNRVVVELAALLHDVADHKFAGPEKEGEVESFLMDLDIDPAVKNHIWQIIQNISFSKKSNGPEFTSPEFFAVRDADRLDAIGAIGIARAFNYGGYAGRPIFLPDHEDTKPLNNDTIHHFYDKLLKLKDRMMTSYGKRMAEERHRFIENFLQQFYREVYPSSIPNPKDSGVESMEYMNRKNPNHD